MVLSYKNDSDEDERLNPGRGRDLQNAEQQAAYDNDFDGITGDENLKKSGTPGDLSGGVRKAETEPSEPSSYRNGFTGEQKKKLKSINGVHFLRRKGPMGLLITGLLTGTIGFSALFSPGLLIVQMKEVMVDKFNTQLASMEIRSTKLMSAKIDNTTGGICFQKINIKCKYSTMSIKQVEKFGAAGIEVEYEKRNIVGRAKPKSFIFEGQVIKAQDWDKTLRTNQNFRNAVKLAYSPKYAGFSDFVWKNVAKIRGFTKAKNVTGDTDPERTKSLNDRTKHGADTNIKRVNAGDNVDSKCTEKCATYDKPTADKINAEADKFAADSKNGTKAGSAAAGKIEGVVSSNTIGSVANAFKATGTIDTACQAYGAVQLVGYAAKTVRAVQLARYFMAFANIADQIKDGTAQPEDVAYFGGILTEVVYDAASAVKRGSATDSFGYKHAAYGDTGKMNNFAMQFLAGGGLTGDLINVTSTINSMTFGTAKTTCRTLANPWVQGGSLVGGIALMLIPGVGQAAGAAKIGVQIATQVTFTVAMIMLPELLKDIVAGNVTDGIKGDDAGNGITSGAGGSMGGLANWGGNGAMKKEDALAYSTLQSDVLASYARDEVATLSPFDPTSRHTFLGSIVASLIPSLSSNLGLVSGSISTMGSILSGALSGIIPKTSALTTAQQSAAMEMCQDYDYKELGIATDPFCNVIYGIPPKYLNKDPFVVIDELGSQIDDTTGQPMGEYKTFVTDCIERVDPLGSSGASGEGDDGSRCVIDDTNANYYLHYVDQRINYGMDGYDTTPDEAAASETTASTNLSKQALAQKIVAKGKVTYVEKYNPRPRIGAIADGSVNGDNESCGININILRIIDAITDKHSISISSINRHCTDQVPAGSSRTSRHYAGNGSALDIAVIDGKATSGRDANALSVLSIAMPILSSVATAANSFSQVGQKQCEGGKVSAIAGIKFINDSCNHVHIDLPPSSDPTLKYSPGP